MKFGLSKGFSLVELLIVMALIAIIGAIAVPNFTKMRDNSNLREAAREISGDIQLYKQQAVAENRRYQMVFDVDNNEYTVQRETASGWENVIANKKVGAGYDAIKIIGNPTFASDTITFQTRGTTNAGTLEIQHEKRLSKATLVTSVMGRVRVTYEFK